MGRPLIESRITHGSVATTLNVKYAYNSDGSLSTLTYPSGAVFTYASGGAGRATQLSDTTNNYVGYSGNTTKYAPSGSLASMTNGHTATFAGIVTSKTYNDRLQPLLISASSSGSLFSLCYDFHLHVAVNSSPCSFLAYTTGDNGDVFRILNNVDSTRSTAYQYDPLDRIQQANSISTALPNCWGEIYTIDPWGNLTNRAGVSGMTRCTTEGLNATATTQNQLGGIGILYDAAGNVTNDGNSNAPTYDAENRILTDAGVTYSYDADGLRIAKNPGTMYWPGLNGEILAETDLSGIINEEYVYFNDARIARIDRPSGTVNYYFSDHLSSASVITNSTGTVQGSYYYFPYGGIIGSTGSDPNHYKFAGKERDAESGFDNFGARYYGSGVGRWISPDLVNLTDERVLNPANTLNKYTYGGNNPLKYVDPDGRDIIYFYDQGGAAGHAVLLANNQESGDSAIESFGPAGHSFLYHVGEAVGPVPGTGMYAMDSSLTVQDLRERYASFTIETEPELTQQVINYIKANPDPKLWDAMGPNCSSQVWKVLRKFKLDNRQLFTNQGMTPKILWWSLSGRYSPDGEERVPKNGHEYGSPRLGYDPFDLLWKSIHGEHVTHRIIPCGAGNAQQCDPLPDPNTRP